MDKQQERSLRWMNVGGKWGLFDVSPKREWVGLEDNDFNVKQVGEFDVVKFARYIEKILKEKNSG